MAGKLYVCATPIGNLGDMTPRVVETLQMVDLIAAEDTRNSIKLLNHFGIHTQMTSYHEYNKVEKAVALIAQMNDGKNVALITDAGTPAVSDPGEVLVRMCHEAGIVVTSLPGAAACITALTLSGMSTRRFCFEGFLPTDKKEKKDIRLVALLDTLEYLKRGGRISSSAALVGGLLSVKPVVAVEHGEVVMLGRARGSKNGSNLLVQEIRKTRGVDFERPYLLGYTGLEDSLLQKYIADSAALWAEHTDALPVGTVGGTIGAHVGPGAVAVAFFQRSDG